MLILILTIYTQYYTSFLSQCSIMQLKWSSLAINVLLESEIYFLFAKSILGKEKFGIVAKPKLHFLHYQVKNVIQSE